jgi:hypothetical protein
MALIHRADLAPTKLQLVGAWLPTRSWFPDGGPLTQVGAYRFDDPDGEVGIEALLVRSGDGPVLQVPLSYRAAPLEGAQLVGTTEHSVLGHRWVYDGCTDPVWITALATMLLAGGFQAEELVDHGDRLQPRQPSVTVRSTGTPGTPIPEITDLSSHDEGGTTVVQAGGLELVVVRVLGAAPVLAPSLTGTWGEANSAVLAHLRTA